MNRFRDILIRIVESKAFQSLLSGIGAIGGAVSRGIGKIAGLADGGIVTKPTLAMVGEGGEPEAVIPLSKMGQMGGGGVNITINTGVGDPEAIARDIRRILNDSTRRTGTLVAA
jgi:SLT domain-containing protein